MVKTIKTKKAIAMIELIFALVIMGIVLMSAPMLIQQSVKSSNIALQQEAIVAAASQASIILSMHWDEANTRIPVGESPILNTGGIFPPAGLAMANLEARNPRDALGIVHFPFPAIGIDTNTTDVSENNKTNLDDVDDFDGQSLGLVLYNAENAEADIGEYVDIDINIATNVFYTQNNAVSTPAAGISNVKFINVNLTSNQAVPELQKDITMQAFSCNIGTYAILGRRL